MDQPLETHEEGDGENSIQSASSLHDAITRAKLQIAKLTGVEPKNIRVFIEV